MSNLSKNNHVWTAVIHWNSQTTSCPIMQQVLIFLGFLDQDPPACVTLCFIVIIPKGVDLISSDIKYLFHDSFPNSPPSSTFGLLAVAVHHLRRDTLILLHVLHHLLADQLEDVLGKDAHGLGHLYCQHVQSQDRPFGDLDLGHHWLTELEEKDGRDWRYYRSCSSKLKQTTAFLNTEMSLQRDKNIRF